MGSSLAVQWLGLGTFTAVAQVQSLARRDQKKLREFVKMERCSILIVKYRMTSIFFL